MECVLRALRKHICAGLQVEQMVHGQPEDARSRLIQMVRWSQEHPTTIYYYTGEREGERQLYG